MRTYIYARVSTDKQTTDNQVESLLKLAPDATVFKDVVSGDRNKEQLRVLLSQWKKGDVVHVYKIDRISRDQIELLSILRKAEKDGVTIKSSTQALGDDASSHLLKGVLAGVAQFEKQLISERTKLALELAKSKGVELGGKRVGSGRRAIKLSESEFEFLRKLRNKGHIWEDITTLFNNRFNKSYKTRTLSKKFLKGA